MIDVTLGISDLPSDYAFGKISLTSDDLIKYVPVALPRVFPCVLVDILHLKSSFGNRQVDL